MFYGNLNSPDTYEAFLHNDAFQKALHWIRQMPADQAPGIYPIEGDEIFVNVHGYDTLPADQCRFESHRRYIDVQYCIAGGECIDIQWSSRLAPDGDFDAAKDLQFYFAGSPTSPPGNREPGGKDEKPGTTSLLMSPGDFAIFFPEDAHRPKVHDGHNSSVRKLVVKIDRKLVE